MPWVNGRYQQAVPSAGSDSIFYEGRKAGHTTSDQVAHLMPVPCVVCVTVCVLCASLAGHVAHQVSIELWGGSDACALLGTTGR
jgi:hypothetical protein